MLNSDPITFQLVIIVFSVASVAVGITLWAVWTFQTKREARDFEIDIKKWVMKIETEVNGVNQQVSKIGADVSYIRGRLEPKP